MIVSVVSSVGIVDFTEWKRKYRNKQTVEIWFSFALTISVMSSFILCYEANRLQHHMRTGSFSRMVLVKQPVANFSSLKRAERKLSLLCSIPSPKTFQSWKGYWMCKNLCGVHGEENINSIRQCDSNIQWYNCTMSVAFWLNDNRGMNIKFKYLQQKEILVLYWKSFILKLLGIFKIIFLWCKVHISCTFI
jgi:hypothetical protein